MPTAYPDPGVATVITVGSTNKSASTNVIAAADDAVPNANAAIANISVATYPNPAVVTVILVIVFPDTTTVATAFAPVPPVNDTFVYVASSQSVGFVDIEVNKASAVLINLPGVVAVVTFNVKADPPAGATEVATSV